MNRGLKIAVVGVVAALALLALVLVMLVSLDWNRARPWINERVSEATGRSFAIEGPLEVSWTRSAATGWRGWVPWPQVRARGIRLANPDWATTGPQMLRVEEVVATINPLRLLDKTLSLPTLAITAPQLALERDKEGRNNWTFREQDKQKSDWHVAVNDLVIERGAVRLVDAAQRADVHGRIDTLPAGAGDKPGGVRWKLDGTFNRDPVEGEGEAGALLSLQESDVKYPVKAHLKVGQTEIDVDGTFTNPTRLAGLDLQLKILGASMAQLFPLTGIFLPETPRFSTAGRVVGNFAPGATQLRYQDFTGKVGDSDIGGTLEFRDRQPRPLLVGEVRSDRLDLKDLRALIGSDSEAVKRANQRNPGSAVPQPPNKVVPVSPFRTDRWQKIDVQVQFRARRIERPDALPLDNLSTDIRLDNGTLALAPLNFGIAGGTLATTLRIDGRAEPARGQLEAKARGLRLKEMFPEIEEMQASVGRMSVDAKLSARGNSLAALAGSATGEIKSLVSQGSVSKFILEAMGLNIGSAVVAKLFGDKQVALNCMAADLVVKDGLLQPQTFLVDTQDATIRVDGAINLDEETLNLEIKPESKGVRLISLRSPLYVTGTFKNPELGVDKGVLGLKAGAAVALGAIAAPVAGLLALINPGPEEESSPCGALLRQAAKPAKAPPPAKVAPDKAATETRH